MDSIHYLGHSGFEINIGQIRMLIDPFFGAGVKDPCEITLLEPSLFKNIDMIFLTHEHPAHADPGAVWEIAERTMSNVIAPAETLAKITISERQKVDVRVGNSFTLKGVDVNVVRAIHPQSVYPVGYIIRYGGVSFYHAGDTYQFNEMMDINVDFAMIPIGGSYTMDPIDAANACKLLRAKYIIPMHYNTYRRIRQDAQEFSRRITRGKVVTMEPDQSISIRKR